MGKRADDLPLDDNPIERQAESLEALDHARSADVDDERDQPWYQFISEIDDLLASGEFSWAWESLTGIKETVEHSRRVSEGQRRAVSNIQAAGERKQGGRRRYEGFGGRWR